MPFNSPTVNYMTEGDFSSRTAVKCMFNDLHYYTNYKHVSKFNMFKILNASHSKLYSTHFYMNFKH